MKVVCVGGDLSRSRVQKKTESQPHAQSDWLLLWQVEFHPTGELWEPVYNMPPNYSNPDASQQPIYPLLSINVWGQIYRAHKFRYRLFEVSQYAGQWKTSTMYTRLNQLNSFVLTFKKYWSKNPIYFVEITCMDII